MPSILLVDDDPQLLDLLLAILRPYGEWAVSTASNGTEAIRLMREKALDLVITDIIMPEMDGLEVITRVRRRHPATMLLAISGGGRFVGTECLRAALALGAHAVLEKPFTTAALLKTVRELLALAPEDRKQSDDMQRENRQSLQSKPRPGRCS